ncbi:hypothetical protein BZK41_22080 [Citrobacter sp. A316]|nr:hypothetical protein BZK41_22080 [Citrobacter sp. A316]
MLLAQSVLQRTSNILALIDLSGLFIGQNTFIADQIILIPITIYDVLCKINNDMNFDINFVLVTIKEINGNNSK